MCGPSCATTHTESRLRLIISAMSQEAAPARPGRERQAAISTSLRHDKAQSRAQSRA